MVSAARITGIFILFFDTFLIGLLPFALFKVFEKKFSRENANKWTGIVNCFTGGIFLGTAILHMLPESRELLTGVISYDYPVTEALTGCGFLMTLTVEHLVRYYQVRHVKNSYDIGHDNKIDQEDEEKTKEENSTKNQTVVNTEIEKNHGNVDDPATYRGDVKQNFRSFLLLLAISFHMMFAGLAVGLQTNEKDAWILLGVLSFHKIAVAFSIGFQLEANLASFKSALLSLFLLSIVAPIGVVIGYVVTEAGENAQGQELASGILQSLSVGCFLYVTFFEILCYEVYATKDRSHWKVLFTVIGFAVIVGIQFVKDD